MREVARLIQLQLLPMVVKTVLAVRKAVLVVAAALAMVGEMVVLL
jgi:hypothetical protein